MAVLTAERLARMAYKYPTLHNTWYLVASACLTVVNQPQEIPKVLHFALRQQLLESTGHGDRLLTDKALIELAQDLIQLLERYSDFLAVGVQLPDILVPYTLYLRLPLPFKYSKTEDIQAMQALVAAKIREVILKSAALAGLPKTINALMIVKNVTPTLLRPGIKPERTSVVNPGHVPLSEIAQEDLEGTSFGENLSTIDTIDGPICRQAVNTRQVVSDLDRGSRFWNLVYTNKVNTRIKRQMTTAYPDLWQYAYHHVYAPLLSFTDILLAKETSMCVVACLIPQNVPPQLKGHIKGALNVGATEAEVDELHQLVKSMCDWSVEPRL